jgi:hypothetical protein
MADPDMNARRSGAGTRPVYGSVMRVDQTQGV